MRVGASHCSPEPGAHPPQSFPTSPPAQSSGVPTIFITYDCGMWDSHTSWGLRFLTCETGIVMRLA